MEKLNEQDQEIVRYIHLKDQKEQAFNLIVKHYKERLYWHIRKMVISHDDTDDVLQNTFLKVWKNLDRFRGEAALFTWLYRIATNETLTFLQTKQKKQLKTINAPLLSAEEILESDTWFDGNEIQQKLQACLMQLPQRQRLVFNMKYFEEMKYQQISEILKVTVGSLKASYHHAVKKIESILKEEML
ncbi:MAG: RNA polymerase sigma factor [Marinilabiliaceae bacterium]|nr:RNA polymerase sigma factor [Marinilabiliaceae bacterium]